MWGDVVETSQLDPLTLDHPKGVWVKGTINKWQLDKQNVKIEFSHYSG